MNQALKIKQFVAATPNPDPRISLHGDWTLHEYTVYTSTNLVAAGLPAWHAVRADTQTKGRGRFERNWVSDKGGLWLSAVLPIKQKSPSWRFLPVAIGFAVCKMLDSLGAKGLRLRWPNDVLVGRRKLAGLLLDQFCPDLVVAGIGINVTNRPDILDGSLAGQTERLSDLISRAPTLTELALALLGALRNVVEQLETKGPECLVSRVNALWQAPRWVRLDLDDKQIEGQFTSVDAQGRLELRQPNKPPEFFEPHQVRCLREIPNEDRDARSL